MADWMLTGNGTVCWGCDGRGFVARSPGDWRDEPDVCAVCAGLGRVPLEPCEIVAAMLAEARATRGAE